MKTSNDDLRLSLKTRLESMPGLVSRIRTILEYHYDQIQRDIEVEVGNNEIKSDLMDFVTASLEEESFGYMIGDNDQDFINKLTNMQ